MTAEHEGDGRPSRSRDRDDYLAVVAQSFALGRLVHEDDLGTWGDRRRWRVRDERGRALLLKESPGYLSETDASAQEAIHCCLRDRGAPVVTLLRAVSGMGHASVHGRRVALQTYAAGRPADITDVGAIHRFGAALASLAVAGAGDRRWPAGDWSVPRSRLDLDPDAPVRLARFVDRLDQHPRDGQHPDPSMLAELHRTARSAAAFIEARAPLPAGFVHGDANPFNCIDDGPAALSTLIDLDDARWAVQLFDLAQAIVHVAGVVRTSISGPAHIRGSWEPEPIETLLDGYESARRLTAGEREALPHYVRLVTAAETVKAFELELPQPQPPADLAIQVARLSALMRAPFPVTGRQLDSEEDT